MKSLPFLPKIWRAKLPVLQGQGEAQTRRMEAGLKEINREPDRWRYTKDGLFLDRSDILFPLVERVTPRYHEGEVAYVPEAWSMHPTASEAGHPIIFYRDRGDRISFGNRWRSPRSMPAWAARWFVQFGPPVPQRVQEITEAEAMAEGAESISLGGYGFNLVSSYRQGFEQMWDAAYPRQPFRSNPFVWVYTFQLVDKPVGIEI